MESATGAAEFGTRGEQQGRKPKTRDRTNSAGNVAPKSRSAAQPEGPRGNRIVAGPLNIVVVDDDAEVREYVRRLGTVHGLKVETFPDADTFLRTFVPQTTGCILLDAHLELLDGPAILRELRARKIFTPVIVTIGQVDIATVVEAMRGGAFDVLGKPFGERQVIATVQRAIAEEARRRNRDADHEAIRNRFGRLTAREREVAELVVAGLSSRGIAGTLNVGEKTVEVYRSRIKRKMNARNSADLARLLQCVNGGGNGNGGSVWAVAPGRDTEVRRATGT